MPSEKVTINTYALDSQETSVKQSHDDGCGPKTAGHKHKGRYGGKGLVWSLILFIFLVLVVFIVLISWAPKWLRKSLGKKREKREGCDDEGSRGRDGKCVDYGKAILWAVVVSIVLVILFWLLSGVTVGFMSVCRKR